jgi:ribosomal subunit interface protein
MQKPLQITYRRIDPSDAIESDIRERVAKLEQFCDNIIGCKVVIEASHHRHHQGNLFHVRIDLTVPGRELVVSREPSQHHAHEDAYVTVRDAFDEMRRQLEDYLRTRRGKVKTHEIPLHGEVSELYRERDYGKITTPDGREVYFHRNSVLNGGFEKLDLGSPVRFSEEQGLLGPQATTVRLIGKHHISA